MIKTTDDIEDEELEEKKILKEENILKDKSKVKDIQETIKSPLIVNNMANGILVLIDRCKGIPQNRYFLFSGDIDKIESHTFIIEKNTDNQDIIKETIKIRNSITNFRSSLNKSELENIKENASLIIKLNSD